MNNLMNTGERNYHWEMKQQIPKIERTEFDRKATAKPKNKRRQNRPQIKLNQIQSERIEEAELPVMFANRSRIRNRREDKANQRPTTEKKCRSEPACFEVTHQRLTGIIAKEDTATFDRKLSGTSNKRAGGVLAE